VEAPTAELVNGEVTLRRVTGSQQHGPSAARRSDAMGKRFLVQPMLVRLRQAPRSGRGLGSRRWPTHAIRREQVLLETVRVYAEILHFTANPVDGYTDRHVHQVRDRPGLIGGS
jgi:hypothetical protein